MARPHIEFIQAQRLPWAAFEARPGVVLKRLSIKLRHRRAVRHPALSRRMDSTAGHAGSRRGVPGAGRRAAPRHHQVRLRLLNLLARRPPPPCRRHAGRCHRAGLSLRCASRPQPGAPHRTRRHPQGDWTADLVAMGLEVMASAACAPTPGPARSPPPSLSAGNAAGGAPRDSRGFRAGRRDDGAAAGHARWRLHLAAGKRDPRPLWLHRRRVLLQQPWRAAIHRVRPAAPFRFEPPHAPVLPPDLRQAGATPLPELARC